LRGVSASDMIGGLLLAAPYFASPKSSKVRDQPRKAIRLLAARQATEQLSYEEALARLATSEGYARKVLNRLESIRPLPPESTSVLDIGAAQGRFVIGCSRLGYRAEGVEPWAPAREMAVKLAEHAGVDVRILPGTAEATGLPSDQFDVVTCASVIEHVKDAQAAFNEVYRILKPGGIFWFATASSRSPRQREINGFPMFGWYPDSVKRRVMAWTQVHKPHLIGYTEAPAIQWFTPGKARRMLRQAGFREVLYDRWDLRQPSEGGPLYQVALRLVKLGWPTKLVADVLLPGCAYATIK
jgi:2-polyprenyl-3-methyl-5-hydroxy-6-metoxy-1,4-benzoquinol methylase